MEVRDFIDDEVTAFRDDGLTPAADRLVTEEFMLEEEAVLEAYRNACDDLAEEIDILFDRSSAYSLIDPDDDTYEDLCGMLDSVSDEVWRADDVLGWVYEYYNVKLLDDLRRKGDREGLEPEDVPAANQFYTPHWVVRMLTDNSLGKLYLEDRGDLQETVERQDSLTPDERKNRPLSLMKLQTSLTSAPISSRPKRKANRRSSTGPKTSASLTLLVAAVTSCYTRSTCWNASGEQRPISITPRFRTRFFGTTSMVSISTCEPASSPRLISI